MHTLRQASVTLCSAYLVYRNLNGDGHDLLIWHGNLNPPLDLNRHLHYFFNLCILT